MNASSLRRAIVPSLLPVLLAATAGAQAPVTASLPASLQDVGQLRSIAEQHVAARFPVVEGQRLHARADELDPRLRLPLCPETPTGMVPGTSQVTERLTVGISCARPKWTVYVPVRVESEMQVLVAVRAAARHATLGVDDVEIRTLRVPGLPATYITSAQQLEGRHLRKPVAPGTALTVDLLAEDVLVRRGQRVTLVARVGGLEVRAQGEAIADAGPTGRVRVLNLASRRIVEGQVETRDRVVVSL